MVESVRCSVRAWPCAVAVGLMFVLTALAAPALLAQAPSVAINEIHYHPADDVRDGEFVELVNFGSEPVDIGGWILSGGIQFVVPDGTLLAAGAYAVVAANEDALRGRYALDESAVLGEFTGTLSNGGERLRLWAPSGYLVSFVDFADSDPWPESADGLGPSLERISPLREEDDALAWAASIVAGGTPGRGNTVFRDLAGAAQGETVELVAPGATWRYFPGRDDPPADWRSFEFDDAAWQAGPAGFGYGDDDDATVLDDMQGNYPTVFIRTSFELDPAIAARVASVVLGVDYDDGFVAYLDGVEVARRNVGPTGAADLATGNHEAGAVEEFAVDVELLREGRNVLALQAHNGTLDSSDLTLDPFLYAVLRPEDEPEPPPRLERHPRDVVLNEIAPAAAGNGWVELYNSGAAPVAVGGRRVELYPRALGSHVVAAGRTVPAGGFLRITESELGFELDVIHALLLVAADDRLVDAINPRTAGSGQSSGRFPDGSDNRYVFTEPTPGAPNVVAFEKRIVINEIMYHPGDENDAGEYIELHNRADGATVDLSLWEFTRGVTYVFPAGTSIPPHGYLVVARNPAAVTARYGIAGVLGPFEGRLANTAETLLLRDALGNPADRVRFADDGSWPEEADGTGPSLELLHTALENRYGPAWAASFGEGTPGGPNTQFTGDPPPVLAGVEHSPALPTSIEEVRVLATASDERVIASVELFFRRDNTGEAVRSMPMLDDGTSDDGIAGNDVFGATIPAQPHDSVVEYWVEVRATGDQSVVSPPQGGSRPYLYLVRDESGDEDLNRPVYHIVMRAADLDALRTRGNNSNDLLNAALIADGRAYQAAGIRYRGQSARSCDPLSYRLQFSHDRDFHGIKRLNLNGCNSWRQWIGFDLLRRSGIHTVATWFRKLAFSGRVETGWHLRIERLDGQFLERAMPDDADGNLYRGVSQANLDYRGETFGPYVGDYRKETNEEENDYSDVVDLCFRMDSETTPDAQYRAAVEERVDTAQWAYFFAAFAVLGSSENSILLNNGDDYFLYHRFSDDRWVLLPWDLDSCFDDDNQELFRPTVDAVERFLTFPPFASLYWCSVEHLLDTAFSDGVITTRIDHLAPLFPANQIQTLRAYAVDRRAYIEERLTRTLLAQGSDGATVCRNSLYPQEERITLRGIARGCDTASVAVDGETADYDPETTVWSRAIDVVPGSTVEVSSANSMGVITSRLHLVVEEIASGSGADAVNQAEGARSVAVDAFDVDSILDPDGDGDVWTQEEGVGGALGGNVLRAPPFSFGGSQGPDQSHAVYRFRFRTPGVYRGYYRARGFARFSDSFFRAQGVNRTPDTQVDVGRSGNFGWIEEGTFSVTADDVSTGRALDVRIGVREATVEVDAIVLSLDGGLSPAQLDGLVGPRTSAPRAVIDVLPDAEVTLAGGTARVTLDGSRSHDGLCDDTGLTYLWEKIDGPAGDTFLGDERQRSVDVEFVLPGAYEYRLTVTNQLGGGDHAIDVTVNVSGAPGDLTRFLRCDANGDAVVNLTDAVFALNFLFLSGAAPSCRAAVDCNTDGAENLTDAIFALNYLFLGGPPPSAPFPACDTATAATCAASACP